MTLNATARLAALSAMAVGLVGTVNCSDRDDAPPFVLGAQWFDAAEGESSVNTLDNPAPQDVIDTSGTAIEYGASVSLSPNVSGIQILFSEPLNADVIEDLTINVDEPVDVEAGILNRKSKYNPGVIAFTGRTGLVEIVDVATGQAYEAVAEYLNNSRAQESITFGDVGLSVTPLDILPSNTEFQIRVFAGVIEDRDGNKVSSAIRTQIPAEGGRAFTVGDVTDASGRPIAAVAVFTTDGVAFSALTAPTLPDAVANPPGTSVIDDPNTAEDPTTAETESVPTFTYQRENAILVEFNTDVDPTSFGTAFTLTKGATVIPVTVHAAQSGDRFQLEDDGTRSVDADGNFIPLDPTDLGNAVELTTTPALTAGTYELRIDPTYTDSFGNDTTDGIQILEVVVE